MRSRLKLAVLTACAGALLSSCAVSLPTPHPDPQPESPYPALSEEQINRVIEDTNKALATSDEAGNIEALKARLVGPALIMRAAEYSIHGATGGAEKIQNLKLEPQLVAVGASDTWPRMFMVISQPEDNTGTRLVMFVQNTPRSKYQIWGWTRLFGGLSLPTTNVPALGSAQITADQTGLSMTPKEAVAAYAEVLGNAESPKAKYFSTDKFMEKYRKDIEQARTAIGQSGAITDVAKPGSNGILGLTTTDGSALIMADIDFSLIFQRSPNAEPFSLTGPIAVFMGDNKEVTGTIGASYIATVVMVIPPAGAENTTIKVLGAERLLRNVSRDDNTMHQ